MPRNIFKSARILAGTAFLVAGAATITIAPAKALVLQDTTEYTIKRVYAAKQTDTYRLTFQMKVDNPMLGGEADVKLGLRMKESIKEVKPDGTMTLVIEFGNGTVKLGENEFPLPTNPPKVTQTLDKTGKILKVEKEKSDFDGGEQLLSLAGSGYLPPKAVKINDSWDIEGPDPNNKDKKIVIGKATLIGKETVKEIETFKVKWQIEPVSKRDGKDAKVKVEGEVNIDAKSGRNILLKGKLSGDLGMGAKGGTILVEWLTDAELKALEKESK